MATNEPPFHIRVFNDRVRGMNQARSKSLLLSDREVRDLQADIFDLLVTINNLNKTITEISKNTGSSSIEMDGGSF
jgi:uncharacterized protein YlxW (UPF0749 family)